MISVAAITAFIVTLSITNRSHVIAKRNLKLF